jgi:serine/threonine protein kinase
VSLWKKARRARDEHTEGEFIPGYRSMEQIGRGGFSVVYRAHQEQLDRQVAVKVLNVEFVDAQVRKGFVREVHMTGRLSGHPNVVTVLDSGLTAWGRPYIVMDYYERGSLHDQITASGPMPLADVLRIGIKIAGALAAAHQEGILHRDIKPQNILVSRYDEPALADFGIAKMGDALDVSSRTEALTPVHTAPEVLQGKAASVASDLYSLGSTLFHLLAGRPPYQTDGGGIAGLLLRILSDQQPSLPRTDVPASVVAILRRAMAGNPGARFADADSFGQALEAVQAELDLPATEPTATTGTEPATQAATIIDPATPASSITTATPVGNITTATPVGNITTGTPPSQLGTAPIASKLSATTSASNETTNPDAHAGTVTFEEAAITAGGAPASGTDPDPTGTHLELAEPGDGGSSWSAPATGGPTGLVPPPRPQPPLHPDAGSVGPSRVVPPPGPHRPHDPDAGKPDGERRITPFVMAPPTAPPGDPDDTVWVNGSSRSRRGSRLLSILGVVALLLGAVTVPLWLGRTATRADGPGAQPSASASGTVAPRSSAGAPTPRPGPVPAPGQPRVVDNGVAARLQWSLAAGADVYPVLVQVAPTAGSSQLIPLPGGTTGYTATGLSKSGGYCFLVGLLLQLGTKNQPAVEVWSSPTCIRGAIAATPGA